MTILRLSLLALLAAQSAAFLRQQTANRNIVGSSAATNPLSVRCRAALRMSTFGDLASSLLISDEAEAVKPAVEAAVSVYSKVDKTGFIGFFANIIEQAIDLGHSALNAVGIEYSYGFSIIVFTMLIKALTLPLTTAQLESTTKMQKLAPLQQKIQAKYANDEATKNQLLSQLFQTAQVNPLAGCLPALVQIPIFISLYRALQNLVAENKLDEPFLWIPDLEGPVYSAPPGESLDWIKSIFSGSPALGWHDTLAFFSLPVILFISQTLSQRVLQPPKDPNKVLSEQEQVSQGIVNNLPFIVAFFSLNVPAGLGLYWVINNILTTIITVVVKNKFKDTQMPPEVEQMMAMIDSQAAGKVAARESRGGGRMEMRNALEERPSTSGFGSVGSARDGSIIDAETVEVSAASSIEGSAEEEDEDDDEGSDDGDKDRPKRKKRVKPASQKRGKK